jgi:beta-galactosidase GanA
VVFWGINGLPLRYGLIDKLEAPGRNVTGVWQSGYHKESLDLLKKLVPKAKTFGILACDSESTRPNVKMIEVLGYTKQPPERGPAVNSATRSNQRVRVFHPDSRISCPSSSPTEISDGFQQN